MNNDELMKRVLIGEMLIHTLEEQNNAQKTISRGLRDCLDAFHGKVSNKNIIELMKYNNLWPSTEVDGEKFCLVGVE